MTSILKHGCALFMVLLASSGVRGQADCVLGVGITPDSTLAQVFQLNAVQTKELLNYSAELRYRKDVLNIGLENYVKRQPQGSLEELQQLAGHYKKVMDSMTSLQRMIDKRLLKLFNEEQYQRYRLMCLEVQRSPYVVTPTVYPDSLAVKKR
ncbi:hypothetical protein [Maribacter sp. 2307ULW6-5]|uniref:hypothetical protein n=1 Tax=Maribacter sp. 2307ULW6-5 TaxID=3386275 RepID=UPI0039BC3229